MELSGEFDRNLRAAFGGKDSGADKGRGEAETATEASAAEEKTEPSVAGAAGIRISVSAAAEKKTEPSAAKTAGLAARVFSPAAEKFQSDGIAVRPSSAAAENAGAVADGAAGGRAKNAAGEQAEGFGSGGAGEKTAAAENAGVLGFPPLKTGIFPDFYIVRLAQRGAIAAELPLDGDQIQPASLDLRLGATAYRLRASFLPGAGCKVADKLADVTLHKIDLRQGAVLETGCVYLVPLLESLALPKGVSAAANPKSSTGRLDIFTRIIADGARAFDTIPQGYRGALYLEISPRSFPILARLGSRLAQMRFQNGSPNLDSAALRLLQASVKLVSDENADIGSGGLALSVDLGGDAAAAGNSAAKAAGVAEPVGYRGKRHGGVIDVDKRAACSILDFWEPIYDRGRHQLILEPNEFYILASREYVHVPPLYAAEMAPFDPLVGEFRVHYAGFFDPGFGHAEAGGAGARAVLEVRSHEVPFILEHGQTIGRLNYRPMLAAPRRLYGAGLNSHYQAQGLKLSKHFKA